MYTEKCICICIHVNMYIRSSSRRHTQSLYTYEYIYISKYLYIHIHINIRVCSSSSRKFAHSSRRAAARQHALLRSPVFTLRTLHAFWIGICHLMTHGSNLTWWVLLCRCYFSRSHVVTANKGRKNNALEGG